MPGGNKRSYILKKPAVFTAGLFKYVCSYVTTKHKRVRNLWKIRPISVCVSRTPTTSKIELFVILAHVWKSR